MVHNRGMVTTDHNEEVPQVLLNAITVTIFEAHSNILASIFIKL